MIASRTIIEIRFQISPWVSGDTTRTLHRGWDGDFASEHDSLLPGNCQSEADGQKKQTHYRRFDALVWMKNW